MAKFLKITKYKIQCPCLKKRQGPYEFQITMSEITNSPIGLKIAMGPGMLFG